jgi:hypothetical protein
MKEATMRRIMVALMTVVLTTVLSVSVALAGNPHFIKNATSATRSGDNLVVTFKEAGLESGSVETVVVSALATASFECINGGDKNPKAANKETVSDEVSASDTFTADKSGNIVGTLTLEPPGPGDFSCPPGQDLSGPLNVSYTNVVVNDTTSGATISLRGTF